MTDTPEVPEGLRPANENSWYILMTLYGEQEGEEIDWELHEKNRRAWNAWAGQALCADERMAAAASSGVHKSELESWPKFAEEIEERFVGEYKRRNQGALSVPYIPNVHDPVQMVRIAFSTKQAFEEYLFSSEVIITFSRIGQYASFSRATFMESAWFAFSVFRETTSFSSTIFGRGAQFDSATFTQGAWFESATFRGYAYFTGTRFGSSAKEPCLPDFRDCQFEKPTSFRQALFLDGYPDFSGAVLHDKTSFTARMDPTSDEIALDKDLEGRTFWPQRTKQDPVSARESCATIRHVLTQQGLPEEAHFFFRREMRFASQIGSFWQRLPYRSFGWLSDFGYSIQRPLWWLAGIWFLGMAAFWTVFSFPGGPPVLSESDLGTAAALSFSNLFPLFGFGRVFLSEVLASLPRWAQVLSGAQTVLSLPLLFFLGLALRQRFRLR